MFSAEQRGVAIEVFIELDHGYANIVAKLGYPNRHTLRNWWEEYEKTDEIPVGKIGHEPKYSHEQKKKAVERYLSHGKRPVRTMKMLRGRPGSRQLRRSAGGSTSSSPASGRGAVRTPRGPRPDCTKVRVVAELGARTSPAAKKAERYGRDLRTPHAPP